jgi:hypothetical protein
MSKFFKLIINVLIAETAGVQKFRTSVLIIFCSIVVGILGFLCLMDLPWKWMNQKYKNFRIYLKGKSDNVENKADQKKTEAFNTGKMRNSLVANDEQLLNRFRIALKQTKGPTKTSSKRTLNSIEEFHPSEINEDFLGSSINTSPPSDSRYKSVQSIASKKSPKIK